MVVDEGFVVDHAGDGLHAAFGCLGGDADAEPGDAAIAFAEGCFDALADGDVRGEPIRYGVGVGVIHGPIENDLGEERRGFRRGVDLEVVVEREERTRRGHGSHHSTVARRRDAKLAW